MGNGWCKGDCIWKLGVMKKQNGTCVSKSSYSNGSNENDALAFLKSLSSLINKYFAKLMTKTSN